MKFEANILTVSPNIYGIRKICWTRIWHIQVVLQKALKSRNSLKPNLPDNFLHKRVFQTIVIEKNEINILW
jgi:hypothetical protein